MASKPKVGNIITVRDIIDMIVYYLMPPPTDYTKKITIVTSSGLKLTVNKSQKLGLRFDSPEGYEYINVNGADIQKSGHPLWGVETASRLHATNSTTVNTDDNYTYIPTFYSGKGNPYGDSNVIKIIDPADNTTYQGVDKHQIEGKMPIPGELISVDDIRTLLNANGKKVYKWTDINIYEFTNTSFENAKNKMPAWSNPGGKGWRIVNQWKYTRLQDPVLINDPNNGLYDKTDPNLKPKESQLITPLQLQNLLSVMYSTESKGNAESVYVLSCHSNCHHSCHCHHHW